MSIQFVYALKKPKHKTPKLGYDVTAISGGRAGVDIILVSGGVELISSQS